MLIATFGPTTAWAGKTITYDGGQLFLEGCGRIEAAHVVEYDRQGHLLWPYDEMRAWLLEQATAAPAGVPAQAETAATACEAPGCLVFDTETSDLPKNWRAAPEAVDNWPHVVQVAWIMCDTDFNERHGYQTLIRPEGWTVAPGAERVHGISTAKAQREGMRIADVLPAFDADLQACGVVVAHNLEFDESVMRAEFARAGLAHHFGDKRGFCTMRSTTDLCRLEPRVRGEYKWPRLSELHELCTGKPHQGAHDAMGDVQAVLRCLRVLRSNGILPIEVTQSA